MSEIIGIKNIEESKLWISLDSSTDSSIASLKANIVQLCQEATQRMKLSLKYFPQYTLHDETHLIRMVGLIPLIAGDTFDKLNPLEIAIIILGVFFHDIGMIPNENEYNVLVGNQKYLVFKERWIANHANYEGLQQQLQNKDTSLIAIEKIRKLLSEMDQIIITEYIRENHAYLSGEYLRNAYSSDKRLEVYGINITDIVAKVCISHGFHASEIIPQNGYNYDEQIGSMTINLSYISLLIRLADILDFDRERTPDILYQSIHFTNSISVGEWEKHRAVQGWTINEKLLRYSMNFEYPVYENVARKFLDIIDSELLSCHIACNDYQENFSYYKLKLPQRVDRSRIGPKDNSYMYFDLEFSLSRNEVVNLLMTNNLYNSPSLCVRELLQNSADALRIRTAQFTKAGIDWKDAKIDFEHFLTNEGIEVLKCHDNGIGMDEDIIRNYFTKVGRSYYKSPEFKYMQQSFKEANADFDPCSQFGIGFMSCFMLGDRIVVETRKDYGAGKEYGKPLVVEINGTGGIISIRSGESTQSIGTTVYIFGRKKPSFLDVWSDKIQLTSVLRGYALGIEFPISAKCSIEEIKEECIIKSDIIPFHTHLEQMKIKNIRKYCVDLSNYNINLKGYVNETFLVDSRKKICLSSDEGGWVSSTNLNGKSSCSFIKKDETDSKSSYSRDVSICLDGVLVTGTPGRPGYPNKVRSLLGWRSSGVYTHASCCIDIRGDIKPEITPARIPVDQRADNRTPKWKRIDDFIGAAEGEIWSKLIRDLKAEQSGFELFWKLSSIYSANLFNLQYDAILSSLYFPFTSKENKTEWHNANNIKCLKITDNGKSWDLYDSENEMKLEIPVDMKEWIKKSTTYPEIFQYMKNLLLSLVTLNIDNDKIILMINNNQTMLSPAQVIVKTFRQRVFCLPYINEAEKYISIGSSFSSINLNHPLTTKLIESKYFSNKDSLQEFATSFLIGISCCLTKNKDKLICIDRWKKIIACKYVSVDWESYDNSLKPPYIVRLGNGKEISISKKMFDDWFSIEPKKDDYLEMTIDD